MTITLNFLSGRLFTSISLWFFSGDLSCSLDWNTFFCLLIFPISLCLCVLGEMTTSLSLGVAQCSGCSLWPKSSVFSGYQTQVLYSHSSCVRHVPIDYDLGNCLLNYSPPTASGGQGSGHSPGPNAAESLCRENGAQATCLSKLQFCLWAGWARLSVANQTDYGLAAMKRGWGSGCSPAWLWLTHDMEWAELGHLSHRFWLSTYTDWVGLRV